MKTMLIVLIVIHGIIHSLGFTKAFNLATIKELTLSIPKFAGVIWLITSLLLIIAGIVNVFENKYWWLPAFIAVLLSQILIVYFWKDSKFGTIPNIIILIAAIVGYANYNFQQMVDAEIQHMLSKVDYSRNSKVSENNISHLPNAIQQWITASGTIGKPLINSVKLRQIALMKMKPEQEEWYEAEAMQYFTTEHPAFIWQVKMRMMSILQIIGRDKLENGKGEMLIKLLGLIPVVDTKDNYKLNTGTIQRYLGEIVWFPSAALSENITWEGIDDSAAKATLKLNGTSGTGTFYFDNNGLFKKYSAQRYFGGEEDSKLEEWVITVQESKEYNGVVIPNKMTATWKLDSGDWDWLKIDITEIEYKYGLKTNN
jgi:hypothetical protein